jgi:tetratricopeptide (TPR) repeat protein
VRQASEDLDRALELDPFEARARRERGRLRLLGGLTGQALADLERAVQLDETDEVALLLRAMARRRHGLHQDAVRDLEAARALGVVVTPALRDYVLGPGEDR